MGGLEWKKNWNSPHFTLTSEPDQFTWTKPAGFPFYLGPARLCFLGGPIRIFLLSAPPASWMHPQHLTFLLFSCILNFPCIFFLHVIIVLHSFLFISYHVYLSCIFISNHIVFFSCCILCHFSLHLHILFHR